MTTPLAEVDLRVGGRYRIHMQGADGVLHRVTGIYQEVDPPRRPNEAVRDRHESGWAGCLAKLATVVSDGAKP